LPAPIKTILELDAKLSKFLWVLLNRELRRLRREIERRPDDFRIKGKDITKYKISYLNKIINQFLKGGNK